MNNVVVNLVTFYKSNNIRSNLAIETIKLLKQNNFEIIIVDGGSYSEFIETITNLEIKIFIETQKDLRESKREAYQKAYETGKDIIICMEPEKPDFVRSILQLVKYLNNNSLDFLLPGRKQLTCSEFQKYTESAINRFYQDYTGLNWDFCFGPLIWRRDQTPYLLNFESKVEKAYWDIHTIEPLLARKEGKRVEQVKIDFTYDPTIITEESSIPFYQKRISQLQLMTETLTKYPELKVN